MGLDDKSRFIEISILLVAGLTVLLLYSTSLDCGFVLLASYLSRDFTPFQRVLSEYKVMIFYISLFLFPHPARLNLDHHFAISTGLFSPVSTFISVSILIFLFVVALASAKKYRLISFCLLWFLGNIVIESSVIGLEIIFEHRNYLPSMMLTLLFLILMLPILRNKWLQIAFICSVVLLSSYWTFERNRI